MSNQRADPIEGLNERVTACRACPRLVSWREGCAVDPPRRFEGDDYWARPVPGFGDPRARILAVGLAPAAHGANRTGRMFTGDRSGEWLYAALHRAGLGSRLESTHRGDGLELRGVYVTAVVRCAPPQNRPSVAERDECIPYLVEEIGLLAEVRAIVCLGAFAWDGVLRALAQRDHAVPRPKPRFGHGAEAEVGPYTIIGSYHPSQQNTFTGKLTTGMLDGVLARALELAERP